MERDFKVGDIVRIKGSAYICSGWNIKPGDTVRISRLDNAKEGSSYTLCYVSHLGTEPIDVCFFYPHEIILDPFFAAVRKRRHPDAET